MADNRITAAFLRDGDPLAAPLDNAAFLPADNAGPAAPFEATLHLSGVALTSDNPALAGPFVLDGDPRRFPAMALAFTTCGEALVPVHAGLHRRPDPASYWDVMVGAGRLWQEPGDGGACRAAFPFHLSNEHENDSHHCVATFLWQEGKASGLVVQKITQTQPDHLPDSFGLWGRVPARMEPGASAMADPARARHQADAAGALPIHPIEALAGRVDPALIEALGRGACSDSEIVSGLVVDGEIFATTMRVEHGAAPFPRAMRFGLWSATKAAFATTALLRLGVHLGPQVARTRIADALEIGASHDGWHAVTIMDCLNMASGIGTGGRQATPIDIYADNLTEPENAQAQGDGPDSYRAYQAWYAARSRADKLARSFACPSYPWGPGEVARYRDQDLFMAGAAMDALWKRHAGADADLFAMVAEEVYAPIGIRGVDINRTREENGRAGLPVTAFGLFLGIDDIARLGTLIADGGLHKGERLLCRRLLADATDGDFAKGLPTGTTTADGEVTYRLAYWQLPYRARSGRMVRIPSMRGYGGNIVQPLWNGITCFRLAHDAPDAQDRYDGLKLPRIADALRPL